MAKIAKLVSAHPMVRVVVDETATEHEIYKAALHGLATALYENWMENVDEIKDDTECPYGSLPKDRE